jgi:hypothetical protein
VLLALTVSDLFHWLELYYVPVLLSGLLVMETIILSHTRREARDRKEHIKAIDINIEAIKDTTKEVKHSTEEIKHSTDQLTRHDYELAILRGAQTAKKRILCYWHSLHPVEKSENYKKINEALITKMEAGVDVRVVVAGDPSRIAPAYELVKEGVDVHFKESLTVSDLRFSIFDDVVSVFGVPETVIKDGKPSRRGADISSRKLNALLATHFEAHFDGAVSKDTFDFKGFVALHCCEVLKDPTNSIEMLAEQLRVDECVIEEACPAQTKDKRRQEEKEKRERRKKWKKWKARKKRRRKK